MTMRRIAFVLAFCAPVLAACGTMTTIEDAVPAGALAQPATGPTLYAPGEYPNLNLIPTPAAPQLTQDQVTDGAQDLRARRDRLDGEGGGGATDRSDELRRIGSSHADDALRQIEEQ